MLFRSSGIMNPYDFDEKNKDYDRYLLDAKGQLARLTSANVAVNFSLNRKTKPKTNSKYTQQELDYINQHPEQYIDFDVPYNLAVAYVYSFTKTGSLKAITNQTASFNGDLSLTPQLKIGFNSWYDITNGKFTNFGLNFYRDLHC